MKQKNLPIYAVTAVLLILLIPQAALAAGYGDVGFWVGLWHGISFPFRLILKLIWTDMTIYVQFDSTYWYHVGFILGFLTITSGGYKASA